MISAIIQARMSSTRLPGKVLLPLAGKPVLAHVLTRIYSCRTIDKIIVATSDDPSDDPIANYCLNEGIEVFRGSLSDVLDRYYQCARRFNSDTIVRLTADCPAIDPIVVDAVVTGFLAGNYDYYCLTGDFPDGLDCEVLSFSALKNAWLNAALPSEREHVCPYIYKNVLKQFKTGGLELFRDLKQMRWTLDERLDYELLENIFHGLYKDNKIFTTHQILNLLKNNPEWLSINNQIVRNEGYLTSLTKDNK